MAATPAIMTLLADAPPVNTVAEVVAGVAVLVVAVLVVDAAEAVEVDVFVTTAADEVDEAADEDEAVAVGVVKVETIPFPLTG
jgi:hypothetical protein